MSLSDSLRRADRVARTSYRTALGGFLTLDQLGVLQFFTENQWASPDDLHKKLDMPRTTVDGVIAALIGKAYLTRRYDPYGISTMKPGRDAYERATSMLKAADDWLLAHLAPADRAVFIDLLLTLAESGE